MGTSLCTAIKSGMLYKKTSHLGLCNLGISALAGNGSKKGQNWEKGKLVKSNRVIAYLSLGSTLVCHKCIM